LGGAKIRNLSRLPLSVRERSDACLAQDEEPEFSAQLTGNISNAELDRLIAKLGRHPLAEGELREAKEGLYVSLSQSQPDIIEYAFCLSSADECTSFSGGAE
jgi:hypothetical protein